jgi:hypothetical protein
MADNAPFDFARLMAGSIFEEAQILWCIVHNFLGYLSISPFFESLPFMRTSLL